MCEDANLADVLTRSEKCLDDGLKIFFRYWSYPLSYYSMLSVEKQGGWQKTYSQFPGHLVVYVWSCGKGYSRVCEERQRGRFGFVAPHVDAQELYLIRLVFFPRFLENWHFDLAG